eukprot:5553998-Pleurochrysis_carterae.AAC.1
MSRAATVLGSCLCLRLVAQVWAIAVGPAALTEAEADRWCATSTEEPAVVLVVDWGVAPASAMSRAAT